MANLTLEIIIVFVLILLSGFFSLAEVALLSISKHKVTSISIRLFDSYALGFAIGLTTFLVLIFGELTPKIIGASNSDFFSRLVAPPIWYMSIVLYPIIFIVDLFLNNLIKITGAKSKYNVT